LVDFSIPTLSGISEVVVTGPKSPTITTIDDLAGQEVFVRIPSIYQESLAKLNERFKREGKKPVVLKPAPTNLEDEDLLEMLNAGLVKIVVVNSHLAAFWKQVFTRLTVHDKVVLRSDVSLAVAMRKGSPKLKAELDAFIAQNGLRTAFGNIVFRRYLRNTQ